MSDMSTVYQLHPTKPILYQIYSHPNLLEALTNAYQLSKAHYRSVVVHTDGKTISAYIGEPSGPVRKTTIAALDVLNNLREAI